MTTEPMHGVLGLSEQELREALEEELERAVGAERDLSAHAIAHSVARVVGQDHLRMAEQLERTGVRLGR